MSQVVSSSYNQVHVGQQPVMLPLSGVQVQYGMPLQQMVHSPQYQAQQMVHSPQYQAQPPFQPHAAPQTQMNYGYDQPGDRIKQKM